MTAALIIATGKTARSNGFHPLAEVGGISALKRLVLMFRQAGVDDVLIVRDHGSAQVEKDVAHMGAIFLAMPTDDFEMLDAVKHGLRFARARYERVLVTHTGLPVIIADTVEQLLGAQADLATPVQGELAGHPVLIAKGLYDDVLAYDGEGGLAGYISGRGGGCVPVEDAGIHIYVGSELADETAARQGLGRLKPGFRLTLSREKNCYGPGTYLLMQLVEDTGSIREACAHMGLSYSKGWRMITESEQSLGFRLVDRQQGGAKGGKSELTPQGRDLMQRYKRFADECGRSIQAAFEHAFDDME